MGNIGTHLHKVRYAASALAFGIALSPFAHLEKQHHCNCFGKSLVASGQKAYRECADGGYRHEEMLVEGIAVRQSFSGFLQCREAYQEVCREIEQQSLPHRQRGYMVGGNGQSKQQGTRQYPNQPASG